MKHRVSHRHVSYQVCGTQTHYDILEYGVLVRTTGVSKKMCCVTGVSDCTNTMHADEEISHFIFLFDFRQQPRASSFHKSREMLQAGNGSKVKSDSRQALCDKHAAFDGRQSRQCRALLLGAGANGMCNTDWLFFCVGVIGRSDEPNQARSQGIPELTKRCVTNSPRIRIRLAQVN